MTPGRFVAAVWRRVRRAIYVASHDVVMRANLTKLDLTKLEPRLAAGVAVRDLTPADLAAIATAFGADRAALYRERLASGAIGVVATQADQPVGAAWMSYGPRAGEGEPPFLYTVTPRAGTGYLFDSFVLPSTRGLGLGTVLKHALLVRAQRDGKQCGWSVHDAGNAAILAVCRKLGHAPCGRLEHRRLLGVVRLDLAALQATGLSS